MNATSKYVAPALIALLAAGLTGCADMSHRDKDTAVGAVVGGVAGAALTGGSAVGTVGGAAVGGVVGHEVGEGHDNHH